MKLGFVTAILPEFSFEEVLQTAADIGYDCVEVMCWPVGKAERRYAGVTHIDVSDFAKADADAVHALCEKYGVSISALGYYPNALDPTVAPDYVANRCDLVLLTLVLLDCVLLDCVALLLCGWCCVLFVVCGLCSRLSLRSRVLCLPSAAS